MLTNTRTDVSLLLNAFMEPNMLTNSSEHEQRHSDFAEVRDDLSNFSKTIEPNLFPQAEHESFATSLQEDDPCQQSDYLLHRKEYRSKNKTTKPKSPSQ